VMMAVMMLVAPMLMVPMPITAMAPAMPMAPMTMAIGAVVYRLDQISGRGDGHFSCGTERRS